MAISWYSSNDPDSPQLSGGIRGSLIAILKACLIDGFGAGLNFKAPIGGWTIAFEEGNRIMFRNDAVLGSGRYWGFDEDNTADARTVLTYAFDVATGVAAGTGRFTANTRGFNKSTVTTVGTLRYWQLVGSPTGFYISIGTASATVPAADNSWFFGDIVRVPGGRLYSGSWEGINAASYATGNINAVYTWSRCNQVLTAPRSAVWPGSDGLPVSTQYGTLVTHPSAAAYGATSGITSSPQNAADGDSSGAELRLYPVDVVCAGTTGGGARFTAGRMPGMYANAVVEGISAPFIPLEIAGKDYLPVPSGSATVFFSLDQADWNP